MISSLEKFDTGLDSTFNEYVISQLYEHRSWVISFDDKLNGRDTSIIGNNVPLEFSDSGVLLPSFNILHPNYINDRNIQLNTIANLIFNICISKQKKYFFKNFKATRFLWNYYNRSSTGIEHVDSFDKNTGSIIYYLNTCDAHTYIKNIPVECEMGKGIIFSSNTVHRGTGPTISKNKFSLNITFTYNNDLV